MRRTRRELVPARLAALTALRAYGLAWVLVAHFLALAIALFPAAVHLVRPTLAGNLAVDMFFMLSGFVLAYNYGDELARWQCRRTVHFWGMRVARIYPVHVLALATWLAWAAVEAGRGHGSALRILFAPASVLQNLLLLQYAWPGHVINPPSWTLGAEAGGYFGFPLLALGLALLRPRWSPWLVAVTLVAAETAGITLAYTGSGEPNSYGWGWFRLVTGFVAGACYAVGWKRLGARGHGLRGDIVLGAGLAGGLVAVLLTPLRHAVHMPPAGYPFVSLVVVGGAAATGPLGRALCNRVAMYVGERSYSVYMLHYLVVVVATQIARAWHVVGWAAPARAAYLVGWVGLALALGFGAYRAWEYPARIRIRRLVDDATGVRAPLVPVA